MFLAVARSVFLGFFLYISGVHGATGICALKGSSVDLPCSAENPSLSNKWYTVHWNGSGYVQNELHTDRNSLKYSLSENNKLTLTITDLSKSDENNYCCRETTANPKRCRLRSIELHVTDLQVQVIPTTEGQTVTLMCSTSCALTETPAVYIWYKNRESLYQDWSPWYQELVSSEEAVRYSCAIEGYEDLRAPEVSVDSVTSTCFSVTYAKGRMCSYYQTSEDKPCSITYPREVHIQTIPKDNWLLCDTSCPVTDSKAYVWYTGRHRHRYFDNQRFFVIRPSNSSFTCAVKGLEDPLSAEVCPDDKNCLTVNYVSRRICALEGSSVDISSKYLHPDNKQPKSKLWFKMKGSSEKEAAEELIEAAGRVEHHDNMKNQHILRIKNLKENDSAEYTFRLQDDNIWRKSDLPGVNVIVTGLKVKFAPSAVVTEDQRVTLTCSTSCPLTNNTNYIWFFNSRPLTLTEHQNKHLVLDPVSSQHAGSYSCAAKTQTDIRSPAETLSVQNKSGKWSKAATAGIVVALLVSMAVALCWWIRRKTSSNQSQRTETPGNLEQQINSGHVYDIISAQPTEPDNLHYSSVHFSKNQRDALYSTVQPHEAQEQEAVHYAAVIFRQHRTPE